MTTEEIQSVLASQREFFASGKTIPVVYRRDALARLEQAILAHEDDINEALHADLGKSASESYMCETALTLSELRYQRSHVRRWSKPHPAGTKLANFPSASFTVAEPYGVALVMSPWNYPFMLTMEPLVGAIAAGNCVVVKPSAYSPATSAIIKVIVGEVFEPGHVCVVEGGRAENAALLDQEFDYIFFTGSTTVGHLVMEKAAAHLTPVSLELGGKSPCVVTDGAKVRLAARRIVFGKYLNCGQTCVAPDYVLVDEKVHDEFVEAVGREIAKMYGEDPLSNPDGGRMVNEKHFRRVTGLIDPAKVVWGGRGNEETLQIEPTVMDGVTSDDAVMGEEIFGPVLPIITYSTLEEAEAFIRRRPKPLALYLFTQDQRVEERFLRYVPFGGGCVNDTIMHLASSGMGFGGVGLSGMGSYHGKESFETFSHKKSILKKSTLVDLPMRYAPYGKAKDAVIRMILR